MAFISSSDKLQKWKYHVDEFTILGIGKKDIDIPSFRIKSITILHGYELNLYPVFKMDITLEPTVYYSIISNKQTVKFKVRIQKYYTEIGSEDKSLMRDYINDTFDLILDDDDYDSDESIRKEENSNDYENVSVDTTNELDYTDNVIELFLFKSDYVSKGNHTVNEILSNATVTDAVHYIASDAGMKNILMTPIDNTNVIPELVIPPLCAKDAIIWLDGYYGMYENGILFYIDLISGITYIISYSGKCTAWKKNEIKETNILIPEKGNSYSSDLCSLKRDNSKNINYVIGDNTNISIRNESISYNEISGLTITTVDEYSGTTTTEDSKGDIKNGKNVKYLVNNTENEWYSKRYVSLLSGKRKVIQTTFGDYDIDSVAPNKKIRFLFEDSSLSKKYNGNYRIGEATHYFIKDGADFTLSSVVTLKEID